MDRLLPPEDGLLSGPHPLDHLRRHGCLALGREACEGAPHSPLTETTSSSQGSSTDLTDHPYVRVLLATAARPHAAMDGSASDTPSSRRSIDSRSTGLSCYSDLPSPSLHSPGLASPGLSARGRPGRSRNARAPGPPADQNRQPRRGSSASSYHRHLFKQVTKVGSGGSLTEAGFPEAAWSFEGMVGAVRSLPAGQPAVPAVAEGLHFMDSRAVAALLKDIAKKGLPQRAIEIFDWLRGLPAGHELAPLCDVYTYTTVISLCGQRQSLRLALELVAEMKGRAVPCNVHTYSALMNTCIKCGELELALDVFDQLKVEGCAANVVTYNTLVDVYGKLGRWQEAIKVLDRVRAEGLQPETRTFNTVIIAANICNQPHEALKVYDRMTASGFQPTDTTFTALVSAYCKAGQLDNALRVFDQMLQQRCERNIITYGSLIGACEQAGRWQLALRLYDEMRRDQPPVAPNTMTYNVLLGACAQGAQSEKAEALFHAMLARRCKPDASAHGALMLAHAAAGHWRAALQALEAMQAAGFCPEPPAYAALLHCLWESGAIAAQAQAHALYEVGVRSRLLASPLQPRAAGNGTEIHITAANSSLAVLALLQWLRQLQQAVEAGGSSGLADTARLCFAAAPRDPASWPADSVTQAEAAIVTVLEGLKSPFRVEASGTAAGLVAETAELEAWLKLDSVAGSIADAATLLPPDSPRSPGSGRTAAAQEAAAIARQAESHGLFREAEALQETRTAAAQPVYAGSRATCVRLAARLAQGLHQPPEAAYRALVLLDYALVAGLPYAPEAAALWVAACLALAAEPLGCANGTQLAPELENALQLPPGELAQALEQLRSLRVDETPVVSPVTALHRYVTSLLPEPAADRRSSDALLATPRAKARAVGGSPRLLAAAMTDPATQHLPPSLLAAAAMAADRVARGVLPVWPASLAAWTGLSLDSGAEPSPLATAARLVIAAARGAPTGV